MSKRRIVNYENKKSGALAEAREPDGRSVSESGRHLKLRLMRGRMAFS